MELVAIIAAVGVVVGAVRVLILAMKTSDEQLTWKGVRLYSHKVRDERRERCAMKVYARRYLSPLYMRVFPSATPSFR